jgi:hypothetical protein
MIDKPPDNEALLRSQAVLALTAYCGAVLSTNSRTPKPVCGCPQCMIDRTTAWFYSQFRDGKRDVYFL